MLIFEDNVLEFTLPELDSYNLSKKLVRSQFLGQGKGRSYYAAELTPESIAPENMLFCDLRRLLGRIPDASFFLAGKACQIFVGTVLISIAAGAEPGQKTKSMKEPSFCPACGFATIQGFLRQL